MKRFLILSILAAFLAIPAISLAGGGGVGEGTVSNITIQESYVNTSVTPSVIATDKYTMTGGGLAFSVNDVDSNDKSQGSHFKGTIGFGGPQTASGNANKTLSNLFLNMSGLSIGTGTSMTGSGNISGSVTYTDPTNTQHNLTFAGSYSMKSTLNSAAHTTGGTAAITPTISSFVDENGNPMPTVLTMKLPTISFTILGNGGAVKGGVPTGWTLQPDGAPSPFYLSLTKVGTLVAGMIVQIDNSGNTVTMNPAIGTIDGSGNINFDVTDNYDTGTQDGNGNEIYATSTTIVAGTVTSRNFGTPEATASGTFVSTDQSGNWNATEGALSNWGLTNTTTAGPDKGSSGTATVTLETQSDGSFLGTLTSNKGESGMVSSGSFSTSNSPEFNMTISMNSTDGNGSPVIKTTTVTGNLKSGTFGTKGAVMSGKWQDNSSDDSGTWTATEK